MSGYINISFQFDFLSSLKNKGSFISFKEDKKADLNENQDCYVLFLLMKTFVPPVVIDSSIPMKWIIKSNPIFCVYDEHLKT